MAIEKIFIEKFRGFNKVGFDLGSNLTVIAGQNGTQKTTLLGILTQTFAITDDKNPMSKEKPLCGGNYKSAFSEKFKLSDAFDKPKSHEWTLTYDKGQTFTAESIAPNDSRKGSVRFWKKGDRSKGSGYIQKPVVYLSLSRLFPIGEDDKIDEVEISLSAEEQKLYQQLHDQILCIQNASQSSVTHIESDNKNTLGMNTDVYDWKMNSAGQDDIGKIILALFSFKRLKETYPTDYKGGILAIDELDATLYPASQEILVDELRKYASKYNIQIIFTTHSLSMLSHIYEVRDANRKADDIKIVYLEKKNEKILINSNLSYEDVVCKLRVLASLNVPKKILTFTEDSETIDWSKTLLGRKSSLLRFVKCKLGGDQLMTLTKEKVPVFCIPNSIVILDGDKKISNTKLKNYLTLPGTKPPEVLLAEYFFSLDDQNDFWGKCGKNYSKQVMFRGLRGIESIKTDRVAAKKWYQSQLKFWGRNASKAINAWCNANPKAKSEFIAKFDEMLTKFRL